jgi:hypothetical protein
MARATGWQCDCGGHRHGLAAGAPEREKAAIGGGGRVVDEDGTLKVLENLDRRVGHIEQILPTLSTREETRAAINQAVAPLATREEMDAAIKEAVAPLATREEMHAAIKAAVAPLATREEVHAIVGEEGERTRRHFDIVAEGLRGDIRLIAEGHETLRTSIVEMRRDLEAADARLDARVTALEASQRRRRVGR